jgi:hypothetical protein
VPRAARPLLRYNARSHTKYDMRQALAMNLGGAYLALLVQELRLAPEERARKVGCLIARRYLQQPLSRSGAAG